MYYCYVLLLSIQKITGKSPGITKQNHMIIIKVFITSLWGKAYFSLRSCFPSIKPCSWIPCGLKLQIVSTLRSLSHSFTKMYNRWPPQISLILGHCTRAWRVEVFSTAKADMECHTKIKSIKENSLWRHLVSLKSIWKSMRERDAWKTSYFLWELLLWGEDSCP